MTGNRIGAGGAAKTGQGIDPLRLALAAWLIALTMAPAAAMAQEASWQARSLQAEGRSENETCRKARANAAEVARAHLGLNIGGCICCREETAEGEGYRCRLEFEVLVRT